MKEPVSIGNWNYLLEALAWDPVAILLPTDTYLIKASESENGMFSVYIMSSYYSWVMQSKEEEPGGRKRGCCGR